MGCSLLKEVLKYAIPRLAAILNSRLTGDTYYAFTINGANHTPLTAIATTALVPIQKEDIITISYSINDL